jgi:hypothetical protein
VLFLKGIAVYAVLPVFGTFVQIHIEQAFLMLW